MDLNNEVDQLNLRLLRVYMKSTQAVFELLKHDINNFGLDLVSFHIMEFLYNKGPHPIQKIGEKFAIPSGSVTYVVDKLEKKGYVQRELNPNDRRMIIAKLTEEGQTLFDDIFPKHAETIADMLSPLTEDDKQQLTEILKKLGLHAESTLKDITKSR